MTLKRLLAIGFIFACTAVGWFILGHTLSWRTDTMNRRLNEEVTGNWGAPIEQAHPILCNRSNRSGATALLVLSPKA